MREAWPQVIYLALVFAEVGFQFAKHGEQKTGTHNGWNGIISALLVCAVLYWGGFLTRCLNDPRPSNSDGLPYLADAWNVIRRVLHRMGDWDGRHVSL